MPAQDGKIAFTESTHISDTTELAGRWNGTAKFDYSEGLR